MAGSMVPDGSDPAMAAMFNKNRMGRQPTDVNVVNMDFGPLPDAIFSSSAGVKSLQLSISTERNAIFAPEHFFCV
jgi:hypothetical protein